MMIKCVLRSRHRRAHPQAGRGGCEKPEGGGSHSATDDDDDNEYDDDDTC